MYLDIAFVQGGAAQASAAPPLFSLDALKRIRLIGERIVETAARTDS